MDSLKECLVKSQCPDCGDSVIVPGGVNTEPGKGTNPDNTTVWCADMGHWAGSMREAMKAYSKINRP